MKCAKFEDGVWGDANLVVQGNNFFANWADFPELGVAKDGSLFVTWPQQSGPGAYAYDIAVARSDDDGKTWSLMGVLNDDRVLGEHGFWLLYTFDAADDNQCVDLGGCSIRTQKTMSSSHQ